MWIRCIVLGLAYSELGQYQQAVEILEKTVDLAPDHVHALVGLGVAEISAGNLLMVKSGFVKHSSLNQQTDGHCVNLAGTLMKQQRYEDSLDAIKNCLAVAPDDIAMMIAYGDCLIGLGRSEESESHFRKAVKIGGQTIWLILPKHG